MDIGSGKGYLSQHLALHYGLTVVGVDAQEINTLGAQTRNRKVQILHNTMIHCIALCEIKFSLVPLLFSLPHICKFGLSFEKCEHLHACGHTMPRHGSNIGTRHSEHV